MTLSLLLDFFWPVVGLISLVVMLRYEYGRRIHLRIVRLNDTHHVERRTLLGWRLTSAPTADLDRARDDASALMARFVVRQKGQRVVVGDLKATLS